MRLLSVQPSMEDFLDSIRDIYQEESFLIGVRLLSGSMQAREAGHSYSDLAGSIVHAALAKVLQEFALEHGEVPGGRCAVFGLGKLGSREMTASSDLDLVIIYDFDESNPESRGKRPLHAAQYYARVTQRLISALTVSTRRGSLYEVDMRLRPSGRQGPVATRLQSFRDYQIKEAETWEHMALTRARAIAGDATLIDDVEGGIADIVETRRDENALARDIATMRKLIAKEKGEDDPWDLKLASGGIIDLEFLIQFLVLRDSALNRSLAPLMFSSPAEIFRMSAAKERLEISHAEILFSAYEEFTAVTQMTRLSVPGQFNPLTAPKGVLRRIASAVNLPDFRNVGPELAQIRQQVRGIFNELLGAKAKV